jgi:peptidoglycan/xylan/chitin deacetylase (PgdA/CDA1 family)
MAIPILMYHQVETPPPRGTKLRGLVVAPESFAWQMWMLNALGYQGLSMRDLEPYLTDNKRGKVVGITLDDGYQNNLLHAMPVLQRYGFTATCYGISQMIGKTNEWDEHHVASKPLMTLSDWQQWIAGGMDVGSHTRHHVDLNASDDELAWQEIVQSKTELSDLLNYDVRHFCYPFGRYQPKHAQMAQQAGYVTATTTRKGRVHPADDAFELNRVMIACSTNKWQFFLKSMTSYSEW